MSTRTARWFSYKFILFVLFFVVCKFFFFSSFFAMKREMTPVRLACVSESNEEIDENVSKKSNSSPESSSPSLKKQKTIIKNTRPSPNQLHVTINDIPISDDNDGDGISLHSNSNASSRRPSVMMQEILQARRPSAIMAALRSPKEFVNRVRRGYVDGSPFLNIFRLIFIILFFVMFP